VGQLDHLLTTKSDTVQKRIGEGKRRKGEANYHHENVGPNEGRGEKKLLPRDHGGTEKGEKPKKGAKYTRRQPYLL